MIPLSWYIGAYTVDIILVRDGQSSRGMDDSFTSHFFCTKLRVRSIFAVLSPLLEQQVK